MLGAIEAGGTKFICAVGTSEGELIERVQIDTNTPEETMPKVIRFFKKHSITAIGIGSFGPIDIQKTSPTYGQITSTPKKGWRNYPFVQTMQEAFQVPIEFNTDVNGAALGELMHGAAQGLDSCLYVTVGTGIGGGAIVRGQLVQGLSHPEMGHVPVQRHPEDTYKGKCPYHGDCVEGMAAGPAIEERWGISGKELSNRPEVWELEAYYLAQALVQYILILSPEKIILGGGVMKQPTLLPLVRNEVQRRLNGYVEIADITENIDQYIVSPKLQDDAGVVGALMLAKQALEKEL